MTSAESFSPLRNLTDSHFHGIAMLQKGIDPSVSIRDCRTAGMAEMIEVGLHPKDLDQRRKLFEGIGGIYFSSGFSPAEAAGESWRGELQLLESQAKGSSIAAIGELGLDWHWNYGTRESQMALMAAQLIIAKEKELPVIIHNREADAEIVELLREADLPATGIMHCFSSDYALAEKCVDLGYLISFAGNVTYKNAGNLRDAVQRIPTDSLLLETDSPFLSPQPVRGRANTPQNIIHTYDCIAAIRNIRREELAEKARANLRRLFGIG